MSADDWFAATGKPRDGLLVHMARAHPMTGRLGCWSTERELTRTACGKTWEVGHVTLTLAYVDCQECAAWCAAHPSAFRDGIYDRRLDT